MLFSKVLVAYDGSNLSKKALKQAVGVLQESHDPSLFPSLTVIHIAHTPIYAYAGSATPYYTAAMNYAEVDDSVFDEVRDIVPSTIRVHYVTKKGQPALTILDYAAVHPCDLIVMGSRGLGPIREFFLGSVSHYVVQNAKVPVLIVK
ncbi:Universal stress protein [compost metagenome]